MTGERLLIIDDERDFAQFVSQVAQGLGYEVSILTDSTRFAQEMAAVAPSTIVVDLVMPDVDGVEIVSWVAQHMPDIRVLLVTGYTPLYARAAEELARIKGLRQVTTLQKPMTVKELRNALDTT